MKTDLVSAILDLFFFASDAKNKVVRIILYVLLILLIGFAIFIFVYEKTDP